MLHLFFLTDSPFLLLAHILLTILSYPPFSSPSDANIPIHALQVTPRYQTLVVSDLQFDSFASSCFVGKLWWIGPLCTFSSLGTVSIVRCSTCHYWASRFIHFHSTRLRVLITLSVFASSIIRTTAGSATSFTVDLDLQFFFYLQFFSFALSLLGIPVHSFSFASSWCFDYFVDPEFRLLLFHRNPVYKPSAIISLFLLVLPS